MFKFTKKIETNYKLSDSRSIEDCFEYKFADNCKLLYTGREYCLLYDTKKYLINKSFQVTDAESLKQIGHYELSNWTIFIGYKDKLFWQGQKYKFKKIKPAVRYSLFNKDTWGHFKFQLSNDNEIITYSFKIDTPIIRLGNPYKGKSFEGSIDIERASSLIALAGLILVERALDEETIA